MDNYLREVLRGGWLILALVVPLSGCLDDGSEVTVDEQTVPLPFERLARGQSASLHDTLEVVVKHTDQWHAIAETFAVPQPAVVDFDQVMMLFAAIPAPSGGYDIQFRSVEVEDGRVVAHYSLGVPGDDCIATMGTTVPFDAIIVRRVDLPVIFERRQEAIRCTFR